jgi:lipopolysaccharide/colanic/teichoic acid biosynthesis glycosyltransferase
MERVEPGDDDAVRAIHRIHPAQERRSVMRPVGLYLFQNAVLDFVPSEGYFDLKEQLFPPLHAQGLTTVMWQVSGYCRTITSLEDYFFANQDVLMGHMKPLPAAQGDPGGAAAAGLPASSKALPPLAMGEDVQVGEEALLLGPTAIGAKTVIGKGAIVNECVILDHASVGRGVYLDSCIVCREGAVKDGLILRETALAQDGGGAAADAGLALRERARLEQEATPWQAPVGVPWYSRVKRFIFSSLTLVLLAPLMLVVAIAIKLDSEGPVFYQQERNGLHGRRFIMYKFRSMVPDADDLRRELQAVNEVDGPMFKLTHDPRVTRVGKFLRDTNIDELPQLWNVLKGDMSLVGPRPLSMDEMRYNPRWRDARLSVRPGMTGMWQVEAHTKLEFNDWIRHDIEYVQHQSVGLDTWILWKTAVKVVHDLIDKIRGVEKDRI